MKRIILLMAIVTTLQLSGQNFGIGFRLGDPSGITLKKYFSDNALELSIGRTHWLYGRYGSGWYDSRFNDWYLNQNYKYVEYNYSGYRASVPIAFQLHYLFQKDISKVAKENSRGLQWYFGFGGQLAFQNYYFNYRYKQQGDPQWYYVTDARVGNIDFGIDGVIGLEYTFRNAPISMFVDLVLFMEIFDDPFLFRGQGGIGARYNF
jgi:hypothetical protein